LELEIDDSSLCSAEVKNEWNYTSAPRYMLHGLGRDFTPSFNNIVVTVRNFYVIVVCDSYVEIQLQRLYSVGGGGGPGGRHMCLFYSIERIFFWKGVVIRSTALYGSNAILAVKLVIWPAGVTNR